MAISYSEYSKKKKQNPIIDAPIKGGISYSDYTKAFGNILDINREYNYNKSITSKQTEIEQKNKKKELNKATDTLQKIYSDYGIDTGSSKGYRKVTYTPGPKTDSYYGLPTKVDYNTTKITTATSNPTQIILNSEPHKKAEENLKKWESVQNNEDVIKAKNDIENKYYEHSEAVVKNRYAKLNEDNINLYDKTLGRVLSAPARMLDNFAGYTMKNDNGDDYIVPSYAALKEQKTSESYKTHIGKFLGDSASELAKQGVSLGLNTIVPGSGTLLYMSDIYADQYQQAIAQNYTKDQALTYATVSTATEYAVGAILGGVVKATTFKGNASDLSKALNNVLTKVIKNHPRLVSALANGLSEGTEEFIQEYLDAINRNAILGEDNKVFSWDTFKNAFYSGLIGLSTGGVNGATNVDYNYATAIENKLIEEKTNDLIKEKSKNSTDNSKIKLTTAEKNNIKAEVKRDMESGNVSIDLIEEIVAPKEMKKIKDLLDQQNMTADESGKSSIQSLIDQAIVNKNKAMLQYLKKDTSLQNVYNEINESQNIYTYEKEENMSKIEQTVRDSAIEAGVNNTTYSRNWVNAISNLANKTGVQIRFVNSNSTDYINAKEAMIANYAKNKGISVEQATSELKDTVINGLNYNGEILLNVDSKEQINFITGHEINHLFENNEEIYNKLQDALFNIAKDKGEFDSRLEIIRDIYDGTNADVNKELTADLLGDYLFTNEKFIQELTRENRNVAQRIYDYIKDLLKMLTGTKEEKELLKVKKLFEKNLNNISEIDSDTKYKINSKNVEKYYDLGYNADGSPVQPGDLVNDSKDLLAGVEWRKYNQSIAQKIKQYGNYFNTIDIINGKIIYTEVKNGKEQVYSIQVAKSQSVAKEYVDFAKEVMKKYDTRKIQEIIQNVFGEELLSGNDFSNHSSYDSNGLSERIDRQNNSRIRQENGNSNPKSNSSSLQSNNKELDNSSFNFDFENNSIPLENRVSGDALLDAQDLIEELNSAGAKIDDNGYVTVYHQTSNENAQKILETRKMTANEPAVFFSTSKNAQQATGRGETKLEFKIPVEKLILDDLFSDNADVKIPLKNYTKESLDVSQYLINNTKYFIKENKNKVQKQAIDNNDNIKYNKDGIFIDDKQEYAKVMKAIHEKQALSINEKGKNYVFTDSKFYIFEDNGFDNVKIIGKIEIIGNENIISKIEKELKYGINNSTKTIDSIINEIDERRRTNSDDNDYTKNRRTTRENDRLSNRKQNQVQQEYDNRQNDRNSQELDNSSFSLKVKQNEIIQKANPVYDGYHTWIRSEKDIKLFEETLEDSDYKEYYEAGENFDESYTAEMAKEALRTQKITVYSSNPIEQGIFVSPSKMEAQSYSATGKVYSKEVNLTDVAWIDPTQGQYAKVNDVNFTETDNKGRILTKQQQEYFKDSKVRDENGNLLEVYHGSPHNFNAFDKSKLGKRGTFPSSELGFYFSSDQSYAKLMSRDRNETIPTIYKAYLDIKNPLYVFSTELTNTNDVQDIKNQLEKGNYDGIIDELGNFVVFNSNQIKNVDNTNPTTNEDIRYSLTKDNANNPNYLKVKDELPIRKDISKSKNTDIAPVKKQIDQTNKKIDSLTEKIEELSATLATKENDLYNISSESFNQNVKALVEENINKENAIMTDSSKEMVFPTTDVEVRKNIRKYLPANIFQASKIYNAINTIEDVNIDNIKQIISKYSDYKVDTSTPEMNEIKKYLRNARIALGPLKNQLWNYSDKLSQTKGYLKLVNEGGTSIDTVYQELSEMYPFVFDSSENLSAEDKLNSFLDILTADNIEQRELSEDELNQAAKNIYNDIKQYKKYTDSFNAYKEQIKNWKSIYESETGIVDKKDIKKEYREFARVLIGDTSTWADKKLGFSYRVNTMKRNLRDIVRGLDGKRDIAKADLIYDEIFKKYDTHQAMVNKEFNKLAQPLRDLNLNDKESVYAQMLGEKKYNPQSKVLDKDLIEYKSKYSNKIDENKVEQAIDYVRNLYDDTIIRVNKVLKEHGFKEIEYRKGYFPHFHKEKQSFLGKLFNWKVQDNEIPTDVAGLTEMFKPERTWQPFNKRRTGDTTDYNLLKGFDSYISGALDWIYHIEDIQKARALENEIRYQHSDKGVQELIDAVYEKEDLDTDQQLKEIDNILENAKNQLPNFVNNVREWTNAVAGKKSVFDRTSELNMNRKVYSTMTNISNRVSGNMVGGNLSSAITNFIPITQSWSQVSPVNTLVAMKETIANNFRDDGTIAKSNFLTNRLKPAEMLNKTTWDKISDKAGIMFDVVDSFTSQVVWRSKYNQNIKNGMSESEAIYNADEFAKGLMAGRSKGDMPTLFNAKNPKTKLITAFQLEVNNQFQYMFKDLPIDLANKSKLNLIKALASIYIGGHVYNMLTSAITGRDSAFDPIGIIENIINDINNEEKSAADKTADILDEILEEVPFVGGFLGGGRLPINSLLPYENPYDMLVGTVKDISNGNLKSLTNEWLNPVYYGVLPMGGGQLKKTISGLKMFDDDLPIKGSYTTSGNLRFPVEDTLPNKIQAAIFGQWANKNAQDYIKQGKQPLKEKQMDEFSQLDMSIQDYWEYRKGLKQYTKIADKYKYINDLDLPVSKKNIMINNVTDRDEPIDMKDAYKYDTYEEFKNPELYKTIKTIADYDKYNSYKEKISDIKEKYSNEKGYTTNERKAEVQKYINSLSLNQAQKIMLEKMAGGYSIKNYKSIITKYLDGLDISNEDKRIIYDQLFN